jgi:outer membrane protein TolC
MMRASGRMRMPWQLAMGALLLISMPSALRAQATRVDTLWLDNLQRAAERNDPRNAQVALSAAQSELRLQGIRTERLPGVSALGAAQYLSDVARIGAVLPGVSIPGPRNDQVDTWVSVRQSLHDPTRRARVALDSAQTLETQSRTRSAIWQQRAAVSEAFFGALLRDAQVRSIDVAITDLDTRITVAARRVASGVALPSEQLLLLAERERRTQSRDELTTDRDASRAVLAALTGLTIPDNTVLQTPSAIATTLLDARLADTVRARPEFDQFERSLALVDARRAVTLTQDKLKLSAFGRAGYGRPGLNPLGADFASYWTAGIQAEWPVWTWGRARRDAEVQELQRRIVSTDESAFREAMRRATIAERARITSLERTMQFDDSIVAMRARILRETRLRHDEGEVSAADYVSRLSEHLAAQLDRDTHRVRLAESRARYLTTLGLEVR